MQRIRTHEESKVSERFLNAVEFIAKTRKLDKKAICEVIGINPNVVALIAKSRRPSLDSIINLCKSYGINPTWVLLGEEKMIRTGNKITPEELIARLEELILVKGKK